MPWRSSLSAGLFATLLLLLLTRPALCADMIDPLSAAEPLVLTFLQDNVMLIDAVLAYRIEGNQLFLPLEEISIGLGLAITFDKLKRRAEGFYLSDENRFYLDLDSGLVESAGQSFTIEAGSVIEADLDLYISLASLNAWLNNIQFEFNANYLFVKVKSDPPLPKVQRQLRNASHSGIAFSRGYQHQLDLPEIVADYEVIRRPLIDVSTNMSWSGRDGLSTTTAFRGVQDLIGLGTNWFVNIDRERRLRDARITFSRKDPDAGLLGPLHLTAIEAGDVGQRGAPLISRGLRGLGLKATDRVKDMSSGSMTELRGELPEGWEAELYQNNILSAFVAQPESGEYVFADLPLLPGSNEFKVVLYGPQGQQEEHRKTVRLRGNQPAPGDWYVDSSVLMQELKSIPIEAWLYNDDTRSDNSDLDVGEIAAEFRFIYGLGPGFSLAANGTTMSLDGQRSNFLGLSTEFSRFGADISIDTAIDQERYMAAGARLATRFFGTGLFLQHEAFEQGFRSPSNFGTRELRRRSELRLNRRFNLPIVGLPLSTRFRTRYEDFVDTGPVAKFNLNTSIPIGPVQLNNKFDGSANNTADHWQLADLDGTLNVSYRHPLGTLRGGLRYSIEPERVLKSVSLSGSSSFYKDKAKLNATVNHEIKGGSSISLGFAWTFPQVEVLTGFNYSTATQAISANIGLRYSLNWMDGGLLPRRDHRTLSSRGFAQAEVFLDRDADGVFSPGDEPLPGVGFKPGRRQEQSDDEGRIIVSGLSELVPTDVILNEETLPDPFLRSTVSGYRVSVRPGAPVQLAFPVVWVSDIEGMALVTETQITEDGTPMGSATRGLGNVQILVLDEQGQEVRQVRSEFDGFFAISSLPSGRYRLVIDPEQAARFGLDGKEGTEVVLRDDTAILPGIELNLTALKPVKVSQKAETQ